MLNTELVRVRNHRGELRPQWVDPADSEALALAARLIELFDEHLGRRRGELAEQLQSMTGTTPEFLLHRGLAKLLHDRCTFEMEAPIEPVELRRAVFAAAAAVHAEAERPEFDRAAVLARVALDLDVDPDGLDRALYADLKDEQVVTAFQRCRPDWLLHRYNLALAQGVLLRAVQLDVTVSGQTVPAYRALFRRIKFFQLMHQVRGGADAGYTVRLDGPLSLFGASQRYGLRMASFLPTLVHLDGWSLEAKVRWGTKRARQTFRLSSADRLRPYGHLTGQWVPDELQWLPERFAKLTTDWALQEEADLVDLGGEGVLVPDFVFVHPSGLKVRMEVLGHWHKRAVRSRLRLLRRHAPGPTLIAISRKLADREDDLEGLPAEVYVFRVAPIAREVLAALERIRTSRRKR